MNISFEKLNNVTGEITVTLEENDYRPKVEKQLKEIGKSYKEPGFRPGHVPAPLIAKKYGAAVKYDVVNKEIGEKLQDYIKEEKLNLIGQPIPDEKNIFNAEDKDFNFKFKVGLVPEFDDHVNKDLHVPYYTITISDKMVDDQTKALQKRFATQIPGDEADADSLIKGEIIELDVDGNPKEGGIVVENGIIYPRYFTDEAQKELFIGKHPGDTVRFNPAATCNSNPTELSSMLNIDKNEIDDHKGDFDFKIKEIIVAKPAELNQEFFDNALGKDKVKTEEEFKEELRNLIKERLESDSKYRFSIDAKDAIMKAVGELELPEDVIKQSIHNDERKFTPEEIDAEYVKVVPGLTWDIILNEVARRFGVKVEDKDIRDEATGVVVSQLSQYGPSALSDQLVNHYVDELLKDNKAIRNLFANALSRKTFDVIRENVSVDGKDVSVEEFNALFQNPQKD